MIPNRKADFIIPAKLSEVYNPNPLVGTKYNYSGRYQAGEVVKNDETCIYAGPSVNDPARLGLDVRKRWLLCQHPELPSGEYVCPCSTCNSRCYGYTPEQAYDREVEKIERIYLNHFLYPGIEEVYQWRLAQLNLFDSIFDKVYLNIAVDDPEKFDMASHVKQLNKPNYCYRVLKNDPVLHESAHWKSSWEWLIENEKLKDEKNGKFDKKAACLRLHAKGTSRGLKFQLFQEWHDWLFAFGIYCLPSVLLRLKHFLTVGAFTLFTTIENLVADWHYSGSFYWVRMDLFDAYPILEQFQPTSRYEVEVVYGRYCKYSFDSTSMVHMKGPMGGLGFAINVVYAWLMWQRYQKISTFPSVKGRLKNLLIVTRKNPPDNFLDMIESCFYVSRNTYGKDFVQLIEVEKLTCKDIYQGLKDHPFLKEDSWVIILDHHNLLHPLSEYHFHSACEYFTDYDYFIFYEWIKEDFDMRWNFHNNPVSWRKEQVLYRSTEMLEHIAKEKEENFMPHFHLIRGREKRARYIPSVTVIESDFFKGLRNEVEKLYPQVRTIH